MFVTSFRSDQVEDQMEDEVEDGDKLPSFRLDQVEDETVEAPGKVHDDDGEEEEAVMARKAAAIFVQEQKLKGSAVKTVAASFREAGWQLQGGPCDESTNTTNAGVGVLTKEDSKIMAIAAEILTEVFGKTVQAGRAATYEVDLG